jgi:cysteine desulfurase
MSTDAPIYLDHNATTRLHDEVRAAMLEAMDTAWGNPSSTHVYGCRAHAAVENARREVAALIGGHADEIVFTSGGTEANNLAIHGAAAGREGALLISEVEHPATRAPVARLGARGREVRLLRMDRRGRVLLDANAVAGAAFVGVMHSNNETGVLQPIAELVEMAHGSGVIVHTDAAQSVGKLSVDVRALGADRLSIAGHKLYAPKGVGALFVRRGLRVEPLMTGAAHERGLRPGTENVLGIVGLGAACRLAATDLAREADRVGALRDELVPSLCSRVPGIVVHGVGAPRLPNTASLRFPSVSGASLLASLPELAASAGSACHEGAETLSDVILAMGVAASDALGTVRLSLGRSTTADDVSAAARMLASAWVDRARA